MQTYKKFLLALTLTNVSQPLWAVDFPVPEVVTLSERVQVLLGPIQHANEDNQGYMINSTVIIGDEGVVLVDPGGTDEVGHFIKQQISKITSKPVTHVINTHSHGDHYLGNIAFSGTTIISSQECRDLVVQTGEMWLSMMENMVGRPFPNTKPVAASVVYPANSITTVTLNGIEMVVWVPPASHTYGDLMIYLPEEKILVAGDILVNGIVPTMQDGVVKNWIAVLEEIQKLEVNVYIPGHGALMKRDQVKSLHDAIAGFYAGVKEGFRADLSESEIRKKLDLSNWEKL